MSSDRTARHTGRLWLGWSSALLSLAYVFTCYLGLATPEGDAWWQPNGFLHRSSWLGELNSEPFVGADVLALALVPILLCICVFAGTRSVVARTIAIAAITCSTLLNFYGLHAFGPWDFFGWQGTLTLLATGLVVAVALATPLIADSALRAPTALRIGLVVALVLAAIAAMRHMTGWDPQLRFNLSPWPAVSIFGLDMVSYALAGGYLALAIALSGGRGRSPLLALVGALGLGGWIALHFGLHAPLLWLMLPFALTLGISHWRLETDRRAALARSLLVGGIVLAAAVFTGGALASGDHAHSRYVLAPQVISALERYLAREQVYPDSLEELVEAGDLASVPRPRTGFGVVYTLGLLEPPTFDYQGLGSSYVLEFASAEWVQCAYTPPWIDEEELDEDELEEIDEPWACPDTRPDLW